MTTEGICRKPKILKIPINVKYKQPMCRPLTANKCMVPEFINASFCLSVKSDLSPNIKADMNPLICGLTSRDLINSLAKELMGFIFLKFFTKHIDVF